MAEIENSLPELPENLFWRIKKGGWDGIIDMPDLRLQLIQNKFVTQRPHFTIPLLEIQIEYGRPDVIVQEEEILYSKVIRPDVSVKTIQRIAKEILSDLNKSRDRRTLVEKLVGDYPPKTYLGENDE